LPIRVAPNPQRVDSSNLNPQEFWNFGFQFVALNYQTPGLMMDLQEVVGTYMALNLQLIFRENSLQMEAAVMC
jgi:hypothetical protein